MPDPNDLQVLIPYKQLDALLTAARELEKLRYEVQRCYDQLDAVRRIQTETMDKYNELYKML